MSDLLESPLKAKQKSREIAKSLVEGSLCIGDVSSEFGTLSADALAIVIEALEGATRKHPTIVDAASFSALVQCLRHEAPRVRWEAARTIGNFAKQNIDQLAPAVVALLENTSDSGTVVRWATASALVAVRRTGFDDGLDNRLQEIAYSEKDDGVRKIYLNWLKGRK